MRSIEHMPQKNKKLFFWIAIFSCLVSISGDKVSASYYNRGFFADRVPPPQLAAFSGVTASSNAINLTITYPSDTSDYEVVKIYRSSGSTAPVGCNGDLVVTLSSFTSFVYPDANHPENGVFSYRACIYDKQNNVTMSQVAQNIPTCSGVWSAGFCWYLGAAASSCDTACSSHNECNISGTKGYAGSGGNWTQCKGILNALSVTGAYDAGDAGSGNAGYGCITYYNYYNYRITDPGTTCSAVATDVRRVCACGN